MTTENGQRRTAFLLIAAGAAIVVTATLLIPGIAPWSPPSGSAAASAANSCVVSYGALDPANTAKSNPAKESEFAIGVPVTARDEAGVKAELKERRTCGADGKFDPNVTATHYADWSASGLTSRKVDYANIDAFRAEMIANSDLYAATVTELESLENASAFSVEKVPAGMWSVYAVPDGKGGLTTHMGRSGHVGTAAVFTHGSVVINYRLECGFQILLPAPPAGIEVCANAECQPTIHVPTCEEANNCPPPPTCPPGQGTWPHCIVPKDPSTDSGVNPKIDSFIKSGGDKYTVSNGDGATVANGNQGTAADVAAAQQAAAQKAAAEAAAAKAAQDAAILAANQSGGGQVSTDQNQGSSGGQPNW